MGIECRTRDQQVAGSNPGLCTVEWNPGQIVHTHVPLWPSSINMVSWEGNVALAMRQIVVVYPSTGSRPWNGRWAYAIVREQESSTYAWMYRQSSLVSIRCHEMTFPSRNNRNQDVYSSIKSCHVTTFKCHPFSEAKETKLPSTTDTIKDMNAASICYTSCLSHSVIYVYVFKRCPNTQ